MSLFLACYLCFGVVAIAIANLGLTSSAHAVILCELELKRLGYLEVSQ